MTTEEIYKLIMSTPSTPNPIISYGRRNGRSYTQSMLMKSLKLGNTWYEFGSVDEYIKNIFPINVIMIPDYIIYLQEAPFYSMLHSWHMSITFYDIISSYKLAIIYCKGDLNMLKNLIGINSKPLKDYEIYNSYNNYKKLQIAFDNLFLSRDVVNSIKRQVVPEYYY